MINYGPKVVHKINHRRSFKLGSQKNLHSPQEIAYRCDCVKCLWGWYIFNSGMLLIPFLHCGESLHPFLIFNFNLSFKNLCSIYIHPSEELKLGNTVFYKPANCKWRTVSASTQEAEIWFGIVLLSSIWGAPMLTLVPLLWDVFCSQNSFVAPFFIDSVAATATAVLSVSFSSSSSHLLVYIRSTCSCSSLFPFLCTLSTDVIHVIWIQSPPIFLDCHSLQPSIHSALELVPSLSHQARIQPL